MVKPLEYNRRKRQQEQQPQVSMPILNKSRKLDNKQPW